MGSGIGRRLILGVTGHRHEQLGTAGMERLRGEVRAVLQAIRRDFTDRTEFRLVCSLASGADSLAADVARDLGWTLQAVLPAPREVYARDFEEAGRHGDYLRRLDAADAVFELPGGAPDAPHYERAGRVMLDQCDLLLAVWNGLPARGRGGTAQIVDEAVSRHLPVIHVHAECAAATLLLWSGFDPHGLACTEINTVGRAGLNRLDRIAGGLHVSPADPALVRATRMSALAWLYPLFLAVLGVRRLRASDFCAPDRAAASMSSEAICARSGPFGERLRTILAPRYAQADAEATIAAQLYRSGFVANFSLSAFAVMLALAGLIAPLPLKPLLSAGEVAVVVTILSLTHIGRQRGWHRRWIEQRHLAERLRCLALAAQLGDLSPSSGASETPADAELREVAQALGLPSARCDHAYLTSVRAELMAMLDEQVGYNLANARRMHRLDHRLHRTGTLLFSLGAATCLGVLLLEVGTHATRLVWLEAMSPEVTLGAAVLSALLPAIGAAIYGIRMQGDFASVAARSHVLADALASLRSGLGSHETHCDESAFDQLRQFLSRTTSLMSEERADWRTAHSARPLTLPS